jgi:hypothetical protein
MASVQISRLIESDAETKAEQEEKIHALEERVVSIEGAMVASQQ